MAQHLYNEEYVQKQKAQIIAIANKMLAGQIGIIVGARKLVRLQHTVTNNPHDPDFTVFAAIDSETDDLPVDVERQYWAEYALIEKDKAIKKAEDFYREAALAGCRVLIKRFESNAA